MKRRSKQEWLDLFSAHQQSGLTAEQFCKENQLCSRYFSLRRKQLSVDLAAETKPKPFIKAKPLRARAAVPDLSVVLKGAFGEVVLSGSVSPDWLSDLLKRLA